MFLHIEEQHVFNPAIQKAEFLREQEKRRKAGEEPLDDLEEDSAAFSEKACQQLQKVHKDFLANFKEFKKRINIYVSGLTLLERDEQPEVPGLPPRLQRVLPAAGPAGGN